MNAGILSVLLGLLCFLQLSAKDYVTIGTGGVTGVYYPTGGEIAKIVNGSKSGINMSVESTGGSVFNINSIMSGANNFGFAQSDRQAQAWNGTSEWKGKPQKALRFAFSLYPEIITLVASEDSGIRTVADLKGKRVSVGNPGSGNRGNALQVLEAYGIKLNDIKAEGLKAAECAKMLQDGRIDAYFYTVGHPAGSFKEASAGRRKVRIVPLNGAPAEKMVKAKPYYAKVTIPVKKYYPNMTNAEAEVESVGMLTTIVVSSTEKDDVVYKVTKAVFDNLTKLRKLHPALSDLNAASMCKDGRTAPYHPGALKYFKEKNLVK